jgi:hypothetical protein
MAHLAGSTTTTFQTVVDVSLRIVSICVVDDQSDIRAARSTISDAWSIFPASLGG